jgi:tetratricopeptide (TPR) repeat protein
VVYERTDPGDVRALPIGPEEARILALVDGQLDADDLAASSGLEPARVSMHLSRLEELGAVRAAAPRPAPSAKPRSSPRASVPPRSGASLPPRSGASLPPRSGAGQTPRSPNVTASRRDAAGSRATAPSPTTPSGHGAPSSPGPQSGDIDPTLSISIELQARILDLAARLPDLDHFQVLGVEVSAERVQIKRAYFSKIGAFHPDTYFGKQLGGFTKRMERIFQRLTEAHDVLSNPKAREEYESYLRVLGRTQALEELAAKPPPSVEDLEQLLIQAEQSARKPSGATAASMPPAPLLTSPMPMAPSPTPPARPAKAPPPMAPRATSLRPQVEMVDDPAARRQALARKFGKIAPVVTPPTIVTEESVSEQSARRTAAVKDLHQRYKHRQGAILEQRVDRFARAAEEALAAGNTVSALNTLKIAQTLSGGDTQTVERLAELEKQLGATVADSYLERARYEESNGHHEQAARSYTRAARARPSADLLRSAAECYLKAGTELRLASELAREAVQLAPDRADLLLSLAKIYEAAGMQQSAQRELERALELTPDSDRIKQWLKRIKRGGV